MGEQRRFETPEYEDLDVLLPTGLVKRVYDFMGGNDEVMRDDLIGKALEEWLERNGG